MKIGILGGMRSSLVVVALLILVGAAPALAQQPAAGGWREEIRRLRDAPTVLPVRGKRSFGQMPAARHSTTASFAAIIAESEPNGSVQTADSVALGDRATGAVNPAADADTWFVDLTAGQFFSADVDAFEVGSSLDATLLLLAPNGTTQLAFNDDFDGFDSRISYRVPTTGRYYVVIRAFGAAGGPGATYAINFGTVTCAAAGTEQEPNDSPGTASPVAVGESGIGELCARDDNPAGDVDYWAFTAQAGTAIELDIDTDIEMVVDPAIAAYASDGTTQLAFNDDQDGRDSRLQFSIVTTGTYYATVESVADPGGNPFPYTLHVRTTAQGPGDPITKRAEGLGRPLGIAVGSTGDVFVGDLAGSRVVRVSSQGGVTTFAAGIHDPVGLAFDASGSLLVASPDGVVFRVTAQGQSSRFITDAGFPFGIAVAPDGRIWLTDVLTRSLRRYSPTGQFEARFDAVDIGGSGPGPLAIGPSGEPYFSNGTEIWKLANGQLQRVFGNEFVILMFAFDVAGNIYAPAPLAGRIELFSPTGTRLADPFAVGPDAPEAVAFGRDATGATVARLLATELRIGQLIEVNPAGVAHPGLPVGFVPLVIPLDVAAGGLLGGGGLSAADLQFLDTLGNRNGRYDVGDFQAYLRSVGRLPAATEAAAAKRPGRVP
jgi:pre-peptidase